MERLRNLHNQVMSNGLQIGSLVHEIKKERVNTILIANDLAQQKIPEEQELMDISSDKLQMIQKRVLDSYVKQLYKQNS